MSLRACIKQPLIQDDYRLVTVQKRFHYSVTTQYQQALTGLELVMLRLQRLLFTRSRETFITSAAEDNKQWVGLCWMKSAGAVQNREVHAGVEFMPLARVCSLSVIRMHALKLWCLIWSCISLSQWTKKRFSASGTGSFPAPKCCNGCYCHDVKIFTQHFFPGSLVTWLLHHINDRSHNM